MAYMTGMHPKRVAAVLDNYGKALDLNANILVEYENGVHGVYCCSQVCAGHQNDLIIRIFGTKGAVEWVQERPDQLRVVKKDQSVQIYDRGTGYIWGRGAEVSGLPSGHPEGLIHAFANIYKSFIEAILKEENGETIHQEELDFPNVEDGVKGVRFIHAVVESGSRHAAWVEV